MVRVGVRIDDVFQPAALIGEHGKVAVNAILDRIDQYRPSRSLAADQVCLAVASVELMEEHGHLPTARRASSTQTGATGYFGTAGSTWK